MIRASVFSALSGVLLFAQPPATPNASISGVVKDSVSGRPLPNYSVSTYVNATFTGNTLNTSANMRQPAVVSDEQGRYKLADLPPGSYRVTARGNQGFSSSLTRHITLAGRDLEHLDFAVDVAGKITGRVLDEN